MGSKPVVVIDGKRRCTGCGEWKLLSEFAPRKDRPVGIGLTSRCRPCLSKYAMSIRDKHTETIKRGEYRRKHPEKERAAKQRYNAKHPERKILNILKIKKWREENPERAIQATVNYRRANPEAARRGSAKRRAKIRNLPNKGMSIGLEKLLLQEQGGKCPYCFISLAVSGVNFDHFIPVDKGGANEDWNIQLTCPPCNKRKSNKNPNDFLRNLLGL